ncbi:hypothetical protein [Salinifilum aidingensis]
MPTARPRGQEPIRKPGVWAGLVVILLAGVPWYLPEGTIGPLVLGVPLWMLVAVLFSVVLCGFLTRVLMRDWHLADEDRSAEEGAQEDPRTSGEQE